MADPRRHVCLFGGSFNPPHIGHVFAATWALQTLPVDEVWWMPVYEHAFGKYLLPWQNRLALLDATLQGMGDHMKVCTIEAELNQESRTIDTLRALRQRHPDVDFSLLVGTDIVHEIPRWKEAAHLQRTTTIYAIGRGGYAQEDQAELVLPDVSSTALREAIAEGNHGFYATRMSRKAKELIDKHHWYKV